MKNLLLVLAVTSFALAGATQKEEPKKTTAKKTTAAKRSPTPAKKSNTTAKSSTSKKKPSSPTSSATTKGTDKKTAASNEKAKPKPSATRSRPKSTATKNDDKSDLEKALAIEDPEKKLTALTRFLSAYPKSSLRVRALESLTAVRIALGDANVEAGDPEYGLKLIREALRDAPVPYPEKLFVEIISKVPSALYLRGQRAAAIEAALAVEKNSASNLSQLLTLADFYLSTENGDAAKRLAEAAIKLDEKSVAAYQTLGIGHRLNFDLDTSEAAFAKALEIDAESVGARRSLADMKRALGKSDEALSLYAEVLTKDPEDLMAQTGRILSLFESGKRSEAELELSRSIEADKANVILLAGAAWWYVSN
ncbi:MAG TPA: hypothetical protein VJ781_09055, partial [Pyrinomonadaceae bacterium]|nr:hypothetical protein [Pyrinomonadaceae bacterium]